MVAVLKVYHTVTKIWLETTLSTSQSIYDLYTRDFTDLLDTAASILENPASSSSKTRGHGATRTSTTPFSFELGFLAPLYFTAYRCRVPELRRRAIALLELVPTSEATWEKAVHIALAKRIVHVEEHGFGDDEDDDTHDHNIRIDSLDGDVGRIVRMDAVNISDYQAVHHDAKPQPGAMCCQLNYFWFDETGGTHSRTETFDILAGRVIAPI